MGNVYIYRIKRKYIPLRGKHWYKVLIDCDDWDPFRVYGRHSVEVFGAYQLGVCNLTNLRYAPFSQSLN